MDPKQSIRDLEEKIKEVSLDLDPESMRRAGYQVVDWLIARYEELPDSEFGRELNRQETEKLLDEEMPEASASFERVFGQFQDDVAPNAIQLDHPRFFAFIPSAPNFVSVLADALMAGTNTFAGTWLESSGPSQVELVVIDWYKKILGLPAGAAGLLVSGGSVANLTALAVARRAALNDRTAGAVVYLSDQSHASIDRALHILGFQAKQMRRIPADSEYRLDAAHLAAAIGEDLKSERKPFAVVVNAGTTNTGAIDPLTEIADIARANSLWLHVDAAYGGFSALTERGQKLLRGIERADSVVLDPHKWFYCPFETGCAIVRKGQLMRETFRILPDYMHDVAREEREVNFCDYGLQLTRSFHALKIWMAVKTFGAGRFREVIDQCLDLAEYAALVFEQSPRIHIVTRPQLGIFTFRYLPEKAPANITVTDAHLDKLNESLEKRILASRKLMISSTRLRGRYVLRLCILNHRTRKSDIRAALEIIEQLGREAEANLA